MVYHVRISTDEKPKWWGSYKIILDLTKKDLMKKIVRPYHRGTTIYINNEVVDTYKIKFLKINETKDDSSVLLPKIQQRKKIENACNAEKKRGIITSLESDNYYVTEEGKDVTNDFIKHEPNNYWKEFKTLLKKKPIIKHAITGFITLIFALNLTYNVIIPMSNQPNLTISLDYDMGRKFFPDEIEFDFNPETDSFIITLSFGFVKIGENPAIFYLKLYDASGMLSRPRESTTFREESEDAKWFKDDNKGSLRIVLQEKPELNNFTLHIEYGMRYPIYPVFGIRFFRFNLGDSYKAWCKYEKVNDHEYQWKDSSIID